MDEVSIASVEMDKPAAGLESFALIWWHVSVRLQE
jgi:hypothetical protein